MQSLAEFLNVDPNVYFYEIPYAVRKDKIDDYVSLIQSSGLKLVRNFSFGSYQGSDAGIYFNSETKEYGLITYSWGSCSICDAFQHCQDDTLKSMEDLRSSLVSQVVYQPSKYDFIIWLARKDFAGTHLSGEFGYSRWEEVGSVLPEIHLNFLKEAVEAVINFAE